MQSASSRLEGEQAQIRWLAEQISGLGSGGLGTIVAGDIPRQPTDRLSDFIPKQAKVPLDFQPGMAVFSHLDHHRALFDHGWSAEASRWIEVAIRCTVAIGTSPTTRIW